MSVWRQIWADVVHEWRRGGMWSRLLVPLSLTGSCARALASTLSDAAPWRGLGHDFRVSWRRLVKTPLYLVFGVSTIALVLTLFPIVHAVLAFFLWQPSTIIEPDRVVQLVAGTQSNPGAVLVSWADWLDFEATQKSFSAVSTSSRQAASVRADGASVRMMGETVSAGFFAVHHTPMLAGRPLVADDFTPSAAPAVVLAERPATRLFGDAKAAPGREVHLGGLTFTVVGVVPAGFVGSGSPLAPPDYWISFDHARRTSATLPAGLFDPAKRQARWFQVRGRLAPTVTPDQASAEVASLGASLEEHYPSAPEQEAQPTAAGRRWATGSVSSRELDTFRPLGLALLGGVMLVVVLACTNLANLALSRGAWRQHELEVRRALGAGRWRLVREETMDTLVIVTMALVVAGLTTSWALSRLTIEIPVARGFMVWMEPTLTWSVVAATAGATAICLLVAGLWPAIRTSRAYGLAARHGNGRAQMRLQQVLVGLQVIGSVSLLMLTSSVVDATTRRLPSSGVDLDRLGVAAIDLSDHSHAGADVVGLRERLQSRLEGVPGVEAAAVSDGLPFGQILDQVSLSATAAGVGPDGIWSYAIRATPGFWRTLDVPIVAGRALNADDQRQQRDVAVISEMVAREVFGAGTAVGRRIWLSERTGRDVQSRTVEVVGVSADTDTFTMGTRRQGLVVRPFMDGTRTSLTLSARAADDTAAVNAIRLAVRDVDRTVTMSTAATGWSGLAGPYYFLSVLGWLSAVVGGLTLALVMAGLYGVLATAVAQARRDMAIRLALGSTPGQLIRLVVAFGARPVVAGLLLGITLGTVLRFGVRGLLPAFRLQDVVDPVGLVVVPLLVAVATLVATWLPARRAARVDPNTVLRQE